MALYTELAIYKTTYELLQKVTSVSQHMPRNFKQIIGERIVKECVECILLIYRANISQHRDRLDMLSLLSENIQVLQLTIRLSKDMKLISVKQYADIVMLLDSIGKQVSGWSSHTRKQQTSRPTTNAVGTVS